MINNERFGGTTKVKFDLSSYVTKVGWKDAAGVDISSLAGKSDLATLKVDKIGFEKTVPAD